MGIDFEVYPSFSRAYPILFLPRLALVRLSFSSTGPVLKSEIVTPQLQCQGREAAAAIVRIVSLIGNRFRRCRRLYLCSYRSLHPSVIYSLEIQSTY